MEIQAAGASCRQGSAQTFTLPSLGLGDWTTSVPQLTFVPIALFGTSGVLRLAGLTLSPENGWTPYTEHLGWSRGSPASRHLLSRPCFLEVLLGFQPAILLQHGVFLTAQGTWAHTSCVC